jgi:chromosomal replication initiator protein
MVDTVWVDVQERLRTCLLAKDFETWIAPLRATGWSERELVLEASSAFAAEWVREHHRALIERALAEVTGATRSVRIAVNRGLEAARPERLPPRRAEPAEAPERATAARPPTPPRCTFANFVVGESNRVAFGAARAVVDYPGTRFNPLFVYGGVGLGKTHLLSAIADAAIARRGAGAIAYLSAENFVNEMIAALRRRQMERFRQRFRGIGTLIVDDIQFLGDKQRSQEEFTHTFNALHDCRKQIVIASDRAPHDLPGFEATLRNRFAAGLLADVRSPDPTLRRALVVRKAMERAMMLPDDVVEHLAAEWCTNGRELEGVLVRLEHYATVGEQPITLDLVREALAPYARPRAARPSLERIVAEVCQHFELTRAELTSPSRAARVALPRQLAMYLCREHTDAPLNAIGNELGGRDHSTVVHALGAIEQRLQRDAALRDAVARLRNRLVG